MEFLRFSFHDSPASFVVDSDALGLDFPGWNTSEEVLSAALSYAMGPVFGCGETTCLLDILIRIIIMIKSQR